MTTRGGLASGLLLLLVALIFGVLLLFPLLRFASELFERVRLP